MKNKDKLKSEIIEANNIAIEKCLDLVRKQPVMSQAWNDFYFIDQNKLIDEMAGLIKPNPTPNPKRPL